MPPTFRIRAPFALARSHHSGLAMPPAKTTAERPNCSICMEECMECDYGRVPREKQVIKTGCGHLYHRDCLKGWSARCVDAGHAVTCPVCRTHLPFDMTGRAEDFDNVPLRRKIREGLASMRSLPSNRRGSESLRSEVTPDLRPRSTGHRRVVTNLIDSALSDLAIVESVDTSVIVNLSLSDFANVESVDTSVFIDLDYRRDHQVSWPFRSYLL